MWVGVGDVCWGVCVSVGWVGVVICVYVGVGDTEVPRGLPFEGNKSSLSNPKDGW